MTPTQTSCKYDFFSGNPSKFTRTNVHQVSSPQKKGSHFFMTLVKPFPSACLSDLFRHGIRNNASERPSGRKPREEAHSLEFSESSSDSYPLFNGSLRKKRTSKKVATFYLCLSGLKCSPFEVFCSFWLFCVDISRVWGVLGVIPFCSMSSLLPYFLSMWASLPTTQNQRIPPTQNQWWPEVDTLKRNAICVFGVGFPQSPPTSSLTFTGFRIPKVTISGQVHEMFSRFSQAKKDCYQRWCFERSPFGGNTYQVPNCFPPTSLSYFKKCRETK